MPGPKASQIVLTTNQKRILEQRVRFRTCLQHEGKRARILLEAATGLDNQAIARLVGLERGSVRRWRQRWFHAKDLLISVEEDDEADLESCIGEVLSDQPRSGGPTTFTPEQVCQIIALACEKPEESERPVTHWTPQELAAEAVKRGIVENISPRTIGRFLKRG